MIIGITGGSGSGKTTLLQLIAQQGGIVLDCDEIYHQLLSSNTALLSAIEQRFPGTVTNGMLDRKKLGNIVFSQKQALLDLNQITHAAVKKKVIEILQSKPDLAAIDAIGLFEGDLDSICDVTVAVTAPAPARISRIMERDSISEEYAKRRIAAQPCDEWFAQRCNVVLSNDSTPEDFTAKCLAFLDKLGIIKEKTKGE